MKQTLLALLLSAGVVLAQGGNGNNPNTPVSSIPLAAPLPQAVNPNTVSCTTSGTAGTTTYYYWVGALYAQGAVFIAQPCVVNTANATLSGSNYDVISWQPVSVPSNVSINYVVLRSTTNAFPGGGTTAVTASTSSTSVNDQSNTLNAYTYTPAQGFNGQLLVDNVSSAAPYVNISGSPAAGLKVAGSQVIDPTGAITTGVSGQNANVYSAYGSLTLAQVNSGTTIVPAVTGRTLKIVGFLLEAVGGSFATCTAVQVDDTAGTPTVGISAPIAALTSGAIVTEMTGASITFTTFLSALTANQGLQILKTGSSCTGPTSLSYRVYYTINS